MRDSDDTAALFDVRPLAPGEAPPRAAFVVLSRNQDVDGVVTSMRRLEHRFNNSQTR